MFRVERRKAAPAERREYFVDVAVENCAGSDLELHDLRTARLRRQEVQPIGADRSGTQTSHQLADGSHERGRVTCGNPIDRHVERFDAFPSEVCVQPIDERRAAPREWARKSEEDADVPGDGGPRRGRHYRRQTRGPIVCRRTGAALIASAIRRSVKSLTGRGRSAGSNQPTSVISLRSCTRASPLERARNTK